MFMLAAGMHLQQLIQRDCPSGTGSIVCFDTTFDVTKLGATMTTAGGLDAEDSDDTGDGFAAADDDDDDDDDDDNDDDDEDDDKEDDDDDEDNDNKGLVALSRSECPFCCIHEGALSWPAAGSCSCCDAPLSAQPPNGAGAGGAEREAMELKAATGRKSPALGSWCDRRDSVRTACRIASSWSARGSLGAVAALAAEGEEEEEDDRVCSPIPIAKSPCGAFLAGRNSTSRSKLPRMEMVVVGLVSKTSRE
jgi:hypothetical protein